MFLIKRDESEMDRSGKGSDIAYSIRASAFIQAFRQKWLIFHAFFSSVSRVWG